MFSRARECRRNLGYRIPDRFARAGNVSLVDDLVQFVAVRLGALADGENAAAMAAYLKTDMPFYGVKKPERVPIMREALRRFPITSRRDYERSVRALWRRPHREEKYFAIGFASHYRDYVTLTSVPLYRQMIVQGAWWDFVDTIAADLVGHVTLRQRERMTPTLDEWIDAGDMWLRRTAILAQLRHKAATDQDLLFRYCLARAYEKEFFIRKAIGWALREYAKTAPDEVRTFVLIHRDAWSGLTYREATKHLEVPPR